jgi:hypothetical protein
MYAVPTQANLPLEVVPASAMLTEEEMGIAPPIVTHSTVLRRLVSFTQLPLYFPGVSVLCTNGRGGWVILRAVVDALHYRYTVSFSR